MPDPYGGPQPDPTIGSPADIYTAIIQGMPTQPDRQRAMAEQLRSQNLLGNLGLATGDRVLAPSGRSLVDQTRQDLGSYNTEQNEQNKLGLSYDEMAQREQIAQMTDARQRELNAAILGSREKIAAANRAGRLDVAKLRQTGAMLPGDADPAVERLVAQARMDGVPNIPNNPKYAYAWGQGLLNTYGQQDENGNWNNLKDIGDALVQNKHDYYGEQRRLQVTKTQLGKTGTAIEEMNNWSPILEDDMSKLKNFKFKPLNSALNIYREATNNPDLGALQTDLTAFKKALAQAQGRGSDTTGVERMASWKLLTEAQDYPAFMTALEHMKNELQIMEGAAERQGTPHGPSRSLPMNPLPGRGGGGAGVLPQGATVDENGEVKLGPADLSPAGVNDGVPTAVPGPRAMHQQGGPVVTTPTPAAPVPAAPAPAQRKPSNWQKYLQPQPPTSQNFPMAMRGYLG